MSTAPSRRLKLDWVYGYRGRDCRSNLYFLPTGEMVYFVAAVVVLYNVEEQSQRHYVEHTDDVKRYFFITFHIVRTYRFFHGTITLEVVFVPFVVRF